MANANDQLKQQIEADPRVVELARSRQRSSQPDVVSAAGLRELGYPVTDDGWKNLSSPPAKHGNPRVIDESDKWDPITKYGALGVTTGGLALELAAPAAMAEGGVLQEL